MIRDWIPELDLLPEIGPGWPHNERRVATQWTTVLWNRDNLLLRQKVADLPVRSGDLGVLLRLGARQRERRKDAIAVPDKREIAGQAAMLPLGERQHLGDGVGHHPHIPHVPFIAPGTDTCGCRDARALGFQPVAELDRSASRRFNVRHQRRSRSAGAVKHVVVPADDPSRGRRSIRVVVVDPVTILEVEQSEISIIGGRLCKTAACMPQHGGDLAELNAKLGELFLLVWNVGESNLEEGVQVKAGIALPRSQHLKVETIAVEQAFDREIVDLLRPRPRRDVHGTEPLLEGEQAAQFCGHQCVGIVLAHLRSGIEHYAAGKGRHHVAAQLHVKRLEVTI